LEYLEEKSLKVILEIDSFMFPFIIGKNDLFHYCDELYEPYWMNYHFQSFSNTDVFSYTVYVRTRQRLLGFNISLLPRNRVFNLNKVLHPVGSHTLPPPFPHFLITMSNKQLGPRMCWMCEVWTSYFRLLIQLLRLI
jgi:hypothetical protein